MLAMNYLEFLVRAALGFEAQGRLYAWLGRYLVAMEPKRMAAYVEAGREAVEKPGRTPDFYEDGWVYVDNAEKELYVTRCMPLLCMRTRYELMAEGSPSEVYQVLAGREGWPVGSEELEAEAMPLSKAPPPDPLHLIVTAWATAMGRRTWTSRTPTSVAITTKGEKWVVRRRNIIDKSSGYRVRRYEYEVAEVEYVAHDGRNVYIIERGDIAYILGGYKALKYNGAIKEIDLAEVPIEALRKVGDRMIKKHV